MTKHFVGNISVRVLIKDLETGDLLVTRDPNDKIFEIPGGRLDEGESFSQNLVREAKEELGIDLEVDNLKYVYSDQNVHVRDKTLQAYIVFLVEIKNKINLQFSLSDEVAEFLWINKNNYKNYKYYDCAQNALDKYFKN